MRPLLWALLPFCAAITLSTYGLTGTLQFLLATLAVPAAALSLVFHGRTRLKLLLVSISWGVGFLCVYRLSTNRLRTCPTLSR